MPELEDKFRKTKKFRLLYILGDTFDSYTGAVALPLLAKCFLVQESRHFPIAKKTEALA